MQTLNAVSSCWKPRRVVVMWGLFPLYIFHCEFSLRWKDRYCQKSLSDRSRMRVGGWAGRQFLLWSAVVCADGMTWWWSKPTLRKTWAFLFSFQTSNSYDTRNVSNAAPWNCFEHQIAAAGRNWSIFGQSNRTTTFGCSDWSRTHTKRYCHLFTR